MAPKSDAPTPAPTPSSVPRRKNPNRGRGDKTPDVKSSTYGSLGGQATTEGAPEPNLDVDKKVNPYTEVGATGLQQYGGFVRDEWLPALQGDRGIRTWREMYDNDPVVGATVFAVQMLLRQVEWRVEPPDAATVEDIVAEREAKKQQYAAQRQQAQQSQLMMAQAGMAAKGPGSPKPDQPGAAASGPKPQASRASGVLQQGPALHAPLDGGSDAAAGTGLPTPGDGGESPQTDTQKKPRTPFGKMLAGLRGLDDFPSVEEVAKAASKGGGGSGGSGGSGGGGGAGGQQSIVNAPPAPGMDTVGGDFAGGQGGQVSTAPQPTGPIDPKDAVAQLSPEEKKGQELAVFVETALHDSADSWADLVSQIATMVVFGFSFFEIVYKKRQGPKLDDPSHGSRFDDGRVGWAKLAFRDQPSRFRWEFDGTGGIKGMWQLAPPLYRLTYIPLQKALLFRTTAQKGNPEGRSLLRSAYVPYSYKRRIQEFEAIGVERNVAGMPIAKVPWEWFSPDATPEQKASLEETKKIVRNLRRGEQDGIVWPLAYEPDTNNELYKLELLGSGGGSGGGGGRTTAMDTDKIITRKNQEIAMSVLADVILLGHEGVGARSLGETKADLFTTALETLLASIADVMNTYAIPRLLELNGEDPARCPKLVPGSMKQIDLSELAQFIKSLSDSGADLFPDPELEDFLRDEAGLPPKQASEDL